MIDYHLKCKCIDNFFARFIFANQANIKTFVGYTFAALNKYIGYFWKTFYLIIKTFFGNIFTSKNSEFNFLCKMKLKLF